MNEGIILKSLKEDKANRTVVLVSHRTSTMKVADVVYEMENGSTYETVAGWLRTAVLSAGNPYEKQEEAELEAEAEGGSQVRLVPEV